MPWSLILSVVPLLLLLGWLIRHEHKSAKKLQVQHKKNEEAIKPVAKLANTMHEKKFGRASSEIGEVFPDLKAVK